MFLKDDGHGGDNDDIISEANLRLCVHDFSRNSQYVFMQPYGKRLEA